MMLDHVPKAPFSEKTTLIIYFFVFRSLQSASNYWLAQVDVLFEHVNRGKFYFV